MAACLQSHRSIAVRTHIEQRPRKQKTHLLTFPLPNPVEILAVFLNDGTCPRTGAQLLRKETVDDMFRNQIPEFPNFGRQPIPAARPDLTNPVSELYPTAGDPPQGWGLSFMLSGSNATGRSKGTVHWAGLPNLWWWCDRENGVAGMVCTQILPFADAKVLGLWAEVESEVYRGLAEAKK